MMRNLAKLRQCLLLLLAFPVANIIIQTAWIFPVTLEGDLFIAPMETIGFNATLAALALRPMRRASETVENTLPKNKKRSKWNRKNILDAFNNAFMTADQDSSKATTTMEPTQADSIPPRLNSSTISSMNVPMVIPDHIEVFYSPPRGDRSGAAVIDALFAHAFSWQLGRKYGGVCGPIYPNTDDHRRLIRVLGLEEELPYPMQAEDCDKFNGSGTGLAIPTDVYVGWKDTFVFTPEWLDYMQQRRTRAPLPPPARRRKRDKRHKPYQHRHHIIVHIRRGDVNPCDDMYYERYFPNSHYVGLIENYTARADTFYNVTIYSELFSFESWQDFNFSHKPNVACQLSLDTNVTQVWRDMLGYNDDPSTNRTLIISTSTFAVVPAIFVDQSTTTVVYTMYGHFPLYFWKVVDTDYTKVSQAKTLWLRNQFCKLNRSEMLMAAPS